MDPSLLLTECALCMGTACVHLVIAERVEGPHYSSLISVQILDLCEPRTSSSRLELGCLTLKRTPFHLGQTASWRKGTSAKERAPGKQAAVWAPGRVTWEPC